MFFRGKSRAVSVSQYFWYTAVLLLILFLADWGYVLVDTLVVHDKSRLLSGNDVVVCIKKNSHTSIVSAMSPRSRYHFICMYDIQNVYYLSIRQDNTKVATPRLGMHNEGVHKYVTPVSKEKDEQQHRSVPKVLRDRNGTTLTSKKHSHIPLP